MKRTLAFLLVLCQLLIFCACGEENTAATKTAATEPAAETETFPLTAVRTVPQPMKEAPSYVASENASPEELRKIAVQAMHDELSIQWFTPKTIHYNKEGAVSGKNFEFLDIRNFAGLPYTSAGYGIFQFLEYYDQKTGEMLYTDSATFNNTIGNTCASSAMWGWLTVCTTIGGRCISNFLTRQNGFLPVGNYNLPDVADYADYYTTRICNENGADAIYAAYAEVLPADVLCFSEGGDDGGHTMMAVEAAHVEKNGNKIDPEKSYIVIQDQRAGFYQETVGKGQVVFYSGRISEKLSFKELFDTHYIPLTCAEFLGTKPYEKASVSLSEPKTISSLGDLKGEKLVSNYALAYAKLILKGDDGSEILVYRKMYDRNDVGSGKAKNADMDVFAQYDGSTSMKRKMKNGVKYTAILTATVANGETFEICSCPV